MILIDLVVYFFLKFMSVFKDTLHCNRKYNLLHSLYSDNIFSVLKPQFFFLFCYRHFLLGEASQIMSHFYFIANLKRHIKQQEGTAVY